MMHNTYPRFGLHSNKSWAEKKILRNEQLTDKIDESYRVGGIQMASFLLFISPLAEKFNLRLNLRMAVGSQIRWGSEISR